SRPPTPLSLAPPGDEATATRRRVSPGPARAALARQAVAAAPKGLRTPPLAGRATGGPGFAPAPVRWRAAVARQLDAMAPAPRVAPTGRRDRSAPAVHARCVARLW